MNRIIRLVTLSTTLALSTLAARAVEPGYVDLGKFQPAEGCEFVEVNVGASLLKFASLFVEKDDADAAALVRNLKHVRVNVLGYKEDDQQGILAHVRGIRSDLESKGWTQTVIARDPKSSADVAVYVRLTDDAIEGVLVTVIDAGEKHAVLVNVVGNIKPEQIAALGERLNIQPLAGLKLGKKAKDV